MSEYREFDKSMFYSRSVKEMSPDEQPREKLMRYGAESLSEFELLAILLRTGSREMNVIDTSKAIINHFDGLRNLARKNWEELKVIPGIATVKAITLEAVFELSRRIQSAPAGEAISLSAPELVAAFFGPRLRDLNHEVFYAAFLNNSRMMIAYKKMSSGSSTSTIVDPVAILREAILKRANSIILIHNHPSGNPNESKADINLTRRIAEMAKTHGIPVDDHVIIAGDKFTSFREKGLLSG